MASIVAMVIFCIGFKFDTGLFAFAAASVLIILHCADEKRLFVRFPGALDDDLRCGRPCDVLTKLVESSWYLTFLLAI